VDAMGTKSEREPLNRDVIVAAAVEIADRDGVKGLTMRKLASSLGYEVMSLYNHVSNKNELLALMVDAVAGEVNDPAPEESSLAAVRALAVSTRAILVRHPWASDLWQKYLPGPARTKTMEDLLRILHLSGLPPGLAHHGFHAVNNHVLGYTMQELGMALDTEDPELMGAKAREYVAGLSPEEYPYTIAHVHQHLDGETISSFELVLDLILDGLVGLSERT